MLISDLVKSNPSNKLFFTLLAAIVLLKLVLQLQLFIGLTNADYLEEHIFHISAREGLPPVRDPLLAMRGYAEVKDFATWQGDPSLMYPFRIAALYPTRAIVAFLGASEFTICLWTMITGIGSVLLLGLIGHALGRPRAGLYGAIALALIPAHILYTSRINTDMPQLFYILLAVYFAVLATASEGKLSRGLSAILAGIAGGLVYLSKLTAGILVSAYAVMVPLIVFGRSHLRKGIGIAVLSLVGFLIVFVAENIIYHSVSGHWLLHWHVMGGNSRNIPVWQAASQRHEFGPLVVWLYHDGLQGLFRQALTLGGVRFGGIYSVPLAGWFAWAFLAALPFAFLEKTNRKLTITVVVGFLLYYLFVELGSFYPQFIEGKLHLTYYHKTHRFIIPCYGGIALTIGLALDWLHGTIAKKQTNMRSLIACGLSLGVLAIICIGSIEQMREWYPRLRNSLQDKRGAAEYIAQNVPPGKIVYIEQAMHLRFQTFTKDHRVQFVELKNDARLEQLCGAWLSLGGSHGFGVAPDRYPLLIPNWLWPVRNGDAPPPEGWQVVHTVPRSLPNPEQPLLRIFKLPNCKAGEKQYGAGPVPLFWRPAMAKDRSEGGELDIALLEQDGSNVTINGTVKLADEGTTVTWNWGDGTIENSFFPNNHRYDHPGTYELRLTAFSRSYYTHQSLTIEIPEE